MMRCPHCDDVHDTRRPCPIMSRCGATMQAPGGDVIRAEAGAVDDVSTVAAAVIGLLLRGGSIHVTRADLLASPFGRLRDAPDGGLFIECGDATLGEYLASVRR